MPGSSFSWENESEPEEGNRGRPNPPIDPDTSRSWLPPSVRLGVDKIFARRAENRPAGGEVLFLLEDDAMVQEVDLLDLCFYDLLFPIDVP
jgi:hypothetical protein